MDVVLLRYDAAARALVEDSGLPADGWAHLEDPTSEELAALRERGVSDALLGHALDPYELARVGHAAGALLMVVRAPSFHGVEHALPYQTSALSVLALDGLVVTLAPSQVDLLPALAASEDLDVGRPTRFALQLVMAVADRFLVHLREIDEAVERLEDQLQASLKNREVLELLRYQKGLTHFTTALDSNLIMLERLEKDERFRGDEELLADALVEIRQAIDMTSISGDILSQMMDAFASIVSNNLNVVMKVLTSLTIVLALPVMVASFYGMNVTLPGQRHPLAFYGTLAVSLLLSSAVAGIFWRKRWL